MRESIFPGDEGAFPVLRAADIPVEDGGPRWLVENLWSASAVGWIAGSPKSCKSWLALDLAVSVSTQTACLGHFPVREQGPALVYLAEDALRSVRERLEGISEHRGLRLEDLDVHVITAPSIRLDLARDQVRLQKTVRALGPRILILDPLVRLHRLDENLVSEVSALLSYLRDLQRELGVAIVLVHHTRKNHPQAGQAGQGLRGSGDFHAWSDSSCYLRRSRGELVLTIEHRAAAAPPPVVLRLVSRSDDSAHLEVAGPLVSQDSATLEARILDALQGETSLTRGALRDRLGVKNERLGETLEHLEKDGTLLRGPQGWRLSNVVPRSPP
ncbi:MAG TPA: AAA family ATPase [Planctomycetota bacterium]|nr:AAA family ATPase [Planctomycetota bacterium]